MIAPDRRILSGMALFTKKTPMQKIEAELAALQARAGLLDTKRAAAQAGFDIATAARQEMLLAGDLDDAKLAAKLQVAVDGAASALAGYDTAITALAASIAEAEVKLAAERLAADRKAASEILAAQIALVDEMLGPWLQISRNLAAALEAIHWHFESVQMAAFIRNATSEVQTAAAVTSRELHASVAGIVAGHMPIPRPQPGAATRTPSPNES
jgi:hypothetical protein